MDIANVDCSYCRELKIIACKRKELFLGLIVKLQAVTRQ